jgi:hypothetical protein
MSKADVLSLQSLKRYNNSVDPIGSHTSVICKQKSGLSIFACVRPR